MPTFAPMNCRKHLTPFLLALCTVGLISSSLSAQTVIDLHRGGAVVRAKQRSDYDVVYRSPQQLRQDSLQYIDCLTRAYNHLYTDSLCQARQCFQEALKLRPEAPANYIIHRELGKIYLAEEKFSESTEEFNIVLRQYPNDFEARRHRAVCALRLNHPQQAIDDCAALSSHALDTTSVIDILFLQAEAHRQLRQYPNVDADLTKILLMNPRNESARLLLAINLERLGQPQEALNRLNLFLEARPDNIDALVSRAEMHLRQHHAILAKEDADEAIRLSPQEPSFYILRAKIYDEIGETYLAEQDRRKAIQLSGTP